jgi:sporulation protein YlmC with PRC-barrel domain
MELGCMDHKDVITIDGRKIGLLVGANVDTNTWKVPNIIVEVNKELVVELGLQKSMLKSPKTNISTELINVVGDVIQLSIDLKGLKDHV